MDLVSAVDLVRKELDDIPAQFILIRVWIAFDANQDVGTAPVGADALVLSDNVCPMKKYVISERFNACRNFGKCIGLMIETSDRKTHGRASDSLNTGVGRINRLLIQACFQYNALSSAFPVEKESSELRVSELLLTL